MFIAWVGAQGIGRLLPVIQQGLAVTAAHPVGEPVGKAAHLGRRLPAALSDDLVIAKVVGEIA